MAHFKVLVHSLPGESEKKYKNFQKITLKVDLVDFVYGTSCRWG